jgi:transposase
MPLIDGIVAETLLADRAYDTNEIIGYAKEKEMQVVIPSKKNRVEQREYDEYIYKLRHLVENAFLKLKRWRGVATRYTKTTSSFKGAVVTCCILQWLRILV